MRFKKLAASVMMAAMTAAALSGCGSGKDSAATGTQASTEKISTKLTVWGSAEDQAEENGKWLQTMCEQFNSEHPEWDITFEYGVCSEQDAGKTIPQDPSNSGDVYFFANDQLQTLIDANAIAKLGGETADYVKNTNSSNIVNSVTVDGNIYGIPFTTNTWFMYYDKSKFTQDDIKSLDKMLEKDKVAFNITEGWYMSSFFLANGCTYFGSNGTDAKAGIDLSGDKGANAAKALVALVNNPNFVNDAQGVGIAGLRDGSVGAFFSGSWDYKSVKEILGDNFGAVSLPTVKIGGTDKQLKAFAGSKAIAVNPNCKYQQIAVALAKYLGGKEAQQKHYDLRNVIPCNTELLKTDKIKNDVLIKAQNDTIDKTSVIQPTLTQMNDYWAPAQNFAKSIVNGEITSDNAATKTDEFYKLINSSVVK
jgi:arabinogalactan oligomer/maltooligosaccharide transport system substrate-binding protein